MMNVMATALGALRAAQQGVQVAAHNVSSLSAADATRLSLQRTATAPGGVATQVETAAADPAAPLGDLLAARSEVLAFTANARLIRRADEMLGTLLDRRA